MRRRVRRRLPRVLSACAKERAAHGLLLALDDAELDVRVQAAIALSELSTTHPALSPARPVVVDVAVRELGRGGQAFVENPRGGEARRSLEHLFTVLSLALDNASGPAIAANYNQPGITYMKGHAGIVIVGADETTNVSVFTNVCLKSSARSKRK